MTPRQIMFTVQPAMARKDREKADALAIAALGAHDPKKAGEMAKELGG